MTSLLAEDPARSVDSVHFAGGGGSEPRRGGVPCGNGVVSVNNTPLGRSTDNRLVGGSCPRWLAASSRFGIACRPSRLRKLAIDGDFYRPIWRRRRPGTELSREPVRRAVGLRSVRISVRPTPAGEHARPDPKLAEANLVPPPAPVPSKPMNIRGRSRRMLQIAGGFLRAPIRLCLQAPGWMVSTSADNSGVTLRMVERRQ